MNVLEPTRAKVGIQQLKGMSGWAVDWRWRARRVSELDLRRLLSVWLRITAPAFGEEADGEAVGFISVRIDDRV